MKLKIRGVKIWKKIRSMQKYAMQIRGTNHFGAKIRGTKNFKGYEKF